MENEVNETFSRVYMLNSRNIMYPNNTDHDEPKRLSPVLILISISSLRSALSCHIYITSKLKEQKSYEP